MYKNSIRKLGVCLAILLFSVILINQNSIKILAASTLTVSQTVDNNKVKFKVFDNTNLNNPISILVMQKSTNSIVYMDQAILNNGEYTFKTLLPKGEYTGYVSSLSEDNVPIQDINIINDEKIVGFRDLEPISVERGEEVVLPSTVIAIFDDGANREVGVQWEVVPNTDNYGNHTVTGKVYGSTDKVKVEVNIIKEKISNEQHLLQRGYQQTVQKLQLIADAIRKVIGI